MDLTTGEGVKNFLLTIQQYVYENMVNQSPNPDMNFIADRNTKRYWCHMPWLNVGPAGREAIHGLTNERPLAPSSIYQNPTSGSDWGVAYYNAVACRSIGAVFGSANAPKPQPDWSRVEFRDGSLAAKILFTTANFPDLEGAFTWKANVSEPNSNFRQISTVRHIQMDIAVRDSSLRGVRHGNNDWLMATYYFDKKYESPLKIEHLPPGFAKMRPMGIQVGFGQKDSFIAPGAQTNQVEGRLNGPADNPKSSCLSCHGTAGTKTAMVPGFMSDDEWKANNQGNLDFSQQFALAKRNIETAPPKDDH
jgi:hypothetical protein